MNIKYILIVFLFLSITSCLSNKVYIGSGIDNYEKWILCKNGNFYRYINGVYGNDSIKGKWKISHDTIYLNYQDTIFYIKDYDNFATINLNKVPLNDSLFFRIVSDDDYKLFYIQINDSIECMTDTLGEAKCNYLKVNKLKIYRNSPYYYASFKIDKGANYFEIKMHNPNSFLKNNMDKILHIDPPQYILKKRNKLLIIVGKNIEKLKLSYKESIKNYHCR